MTQTKLEATSVQCHAPNLMELGNGDLACVWFGGTQEGMADISIHIARRPRGSERWTAPVRLIDDPTRSEQNPILFPSPGGPLYLLYTSQRAGNQDSAVVRYRTSRDHGMTWSTPETLIGTPGTFVRQPPHVTSSGAWILPVFCCRALPGERWDGSGDTSAVEISEDRGNSWRRIEVPRSLGAVHMNVLALQDRSLVALYRSRWADHVYLSRSLDEGRSWSAPEPTALPNNNASIQAIVLADGRLALAYNASSMLNATGRRDSLYDEIEDDAPALTPEPAAVPAAAKPSAPARRAFWGAPRAPMCVVISEDGGRSWCTPIAIETSDGYCLTNNSREKLNRELSYPSLCQTSDGRLHLAYTWYRQTIKHVVLQPEAFAR